MYVVEGDLPKQRIRLARPHPFGLIIAIAELDNRPLGDARWIVYVTENLFAMSRSRHGFEQAGVT